MSSARTVKDRRRAGAPDGVGPRGRDVGLTAISAAELPILRQWINDREQVLLNAPYRPVSERRHALGEIADEHRKLLEIFHQNDLPAAIEALNRHIS